MELTDELRYPTTPMISESINETSSFEDLSWIARYGILEWFLTKMNVPAGEDPINTGSTVLGVAFHRGVAAMDKVVHVLNQIKENRCGPTPLRLDHRRCQEPGRPLYALYTATRNIDPYMKGLYRLDAFLETIQRAIWNDFHGTSPTEELYRQMERFAHTPLPFEKPRHEGYNWLATTLEWLDWIAHFHA
jgi:hypothetical protein